MKKTNRQLIEDCYASGGSPIVSGGGLFVGCGTKNSAVSLGNNSHLNADGGFYNAGGVSCAVQYPFNKTKRTECEQTSDQSKQAKSSETQSNAELNSALAGAIAAKANQADDSGPGAGTVVVVSLVGVGLLIGAIALIKHLRKKN